MMSLYRDIEGPGPPPTDPHQFSLASGGAFIVGFDAGGVPLGGGIGRLEPGVGQIKRMYVVPHARGRGLARALLADLKDAARSRRYRRVRSIRALVSRTPKRCTAVPITSKSMTTRPIHT